MAVSSSAQARDTAPVVHDPTIDLRQTLGCFPTGVTIITCLDQMKRPIGLTVSSFNSLSLDPPLILWSLQSKSTHLDDYRMASHFAVNVLAAEQTELCQRFSRPVDNRFAGVDWSFSAHGLPVISETAATFECVTESQYPGGDHEIFIGRVIAHADHNRTPMIYGKGQITAFPSHD